MPLMLLISLSDFFNRSSPSNIISPDSTLPGGDTRRITLKRLRSCAPDSPPFRWFLHILFENLLHLLRALCSGRVEVRLRFFTSNRFSCMYPPPFSEEITQCYSVLPYLGRLQPFAIIVKTAGCLGNRQPQSAWVVLLPEQELVPGCPDIGYIPVTKTITSAPCSSIAVCAHLTIKRWVSDRSVPRSYSHGQYAGGQAVRKARATRIWIWGTELFNIEMCRTATLMSKPVTRLLLRRQ